jgi:hypothetical protein
MIDLQEFTGKIWHDGRIVELPYTFSWDIPAFFTIDLQEAVPQSMTIKLDQLKERPLSNYFSKDPRVKQFLEDLIPYWHLELEVYKDRGSVVACLPQPWEEYAGEKAFIVEDITPGRDLLICTGYKGEYSRSPVIGLLYQVGTIQADAEIRSLFTN